MDNSRLNKKGDCWFYNKSSNRCKNWHFRVCKLLKDCDSEELCNINGQISKSSILDKILPLITQQFVDQWSVDFNRDELHTRNGGNKLRTYRSLKQISN